MRVAELAAALQLTFEGDESREITAVAPLESAGPADLSFVGQKKAEAAAKSSVAGCLIVGPKYDRPVSQTVLRAADPRASFALAVRLFHPEPPLEPGIHPTASIHPTAEIAPDCEIGPHVSIGRGSRVGSGTRIGAGSVLAEAVMIGHDCNVYPQVSVYSRTVVGDRCILHSGCVVGADGFGFAFTGSEYQKFPQVGRVEIGNDVEIGANTCIDRAALGVTSIGDGTKLDNMVHVGHNCRIGRHVVVAAQTGFSGGVIVEDYAVIGGQVGIGDKARIESRAVLGSGCGVLTSKIVHGGQIVWGTPARPLKQYLAQLANLAKLPQLREEVAELRKKLKELETS